MLFVNFVANLAFRDVSYLLAKAQVAQAIDLLVRLPRAGSTGIPRSFPILLSVRITSELHHLLVANLIVTLLHIVDRMDIIAVKTAKFVCRIA